MLFQVFQVSTNYSSIIENLHKLLKSFHKNGKEIVFVDPLMILRSVKEEGFKDIAIVPEIEKVKRVYTIFACRTDNAFDNVGWLYFICPQEQRSNNQHGN